MWPSDKTTKKEHGKSQLKLAMEKVEAIPTKVIARDQLANPPTDEWFAANRKSLRAKGWT